MEIIEKIVSIFMELSSEAIAAFIGLLGGYLLEGRKIKIEQKINFQNNIGNEIAEALKVIKDLCIEATEYERYKFEEALENGHVVKAFELGVYPSIMNSMESLVNYFSKINDTRRTQEYYLNRECAAHLLYIEQYLNELMTYILSIKMGNNMPEMGCILYKDIQDWYTSFEKSITKDMNKHRVRIHIHKGFLWNISKNNLQKKLYNKSLLVLMQKESGLSKKEKKIKKMIDTLLNDLKI